MTPEQLRAVADWNAEKGCQLYRCSVHEKNHVRQEQMLKDFARHVVIADVLRRFAWQLDHTFRPRARHKRAA